MRSTNNFLSIHSFDAKLRFGGAFFWEGSATSMGGAKEGERESGELFAGESDAFLRRGMRGGIELFNPLQTGGKPRMIGDLDGESGTRIEFQQKGSALPVEHDVRA